MAAIVAAATGAGRSDVWLRDGGELRAAASWPADAGPRPAITLTGGALPAAAAGTDRLVEVRHGGELLGALSVTKKRGDAVTPTEDRLIGNLATQAGLVLRNAGLTEQLMARLADLRASRERLVTAQDRERRRLERDLRDGAQRDLARLASKLGQAARALDQDEAQAKALLNEVIAEIAGTLANLRELARGIYPPLLADMGVAAALDAQARKAAIAVSVEADGIGRYPQEIEAAVYFCALEALRSAVGHADAACASVRLSARDGELRFEGRWRRRIRRRPAGDGRPDRRPRREDPHRSGPRPGHQDQRQRARHRHRLTGAALRRARELADGVAGGQPVPAHGLAVGDRDRVELQVQLGCQVERHPLGPLRLHHHLVLAENRVLELLQHPPGLVEVVVTADEHVPGTAVGGDRLGGEEVHHAALAAPAEAERDGVGQVQLVAAAAFRRPGLLVGEDREVAGVGRLRPDDRIVQNVSFGAYLVAWHDRPCGVAQQARVHPREVPEVGEVLHLAGGVTAPAVGARRHHRPPAVLQFGHLGQRPARLCQRDPDQAVPFLAAERADPGLGRHPRRVCELGDGRAAAVGPVAPAVVGADELVAADPAERERRAPVHAQVGVGARLPVRAAPQDQRLAEQIGVKGPAGEVVAERHRMPAFPQRGHIGERPRCRHRPLLRMPASRCERPGTGGSGNRRPPVHVWTRRLCAVTRRGYTRDEDGRAPGRWRRRPWRPGVRGGA